MFIEHYTPLMLSVIERSGLRRTDEAMDVYVRVCEHLVADDCARLRRHDPAKGELAAWLTVVVRRVVVDWARSRKGRRRIFGSIAALDAFDRDVFELRYWQGHPATAIVELAAGRGHPRPTLLEVFDALERIEQALSARQRAELLTMIARSVGSERLEDEDGRLAMDPADAGADPERQLHDREAEKILAAAVAGLPRQDALILTMLYVDGASKREVERALHIPPLGAARMRDLHERLRARLKELMGT